MPQKSKHAVEIPTSGYFTAVQKVAPGLYEIVLYKDGYEKVTSDALPAWHPRVLPALISGKVINKTI
jgi:hypothetical protein